TDRLASSLDTASGELRKMADAADGSSPAGGIVSSLADSAQQFSRRLDEGGPEGLMDDVRRMGREHPVRFLAMAAAAGFAAARLVKSTDTETIKREISGSSGGTSGGQI